jgi:hypothetical protein
MKTDTRNTVNLKEPGPHAAASPTPTPVPAAGTDIEAELLALAQEEESLNRRKAERREQYWTLSISSITATIEKLVSNGFDRTTIAKALGFGVNGKSTATAKKGTGPTTHDGWYALFLNAGIRSYLKSHPDLAATLKSQKVAPADYAKHLPDSDLAALKTTARQKAESKCPASTTSEASSK